MLREENRMRLMRCLHDLEEPYREVFMLRVFGELKYAQISALFGKTESWCARDVLPREAGNAEKNPGGGWRR